MQSDTAVLVHYNHSWLIWMLFFIGSSIHTASVLQKTKVKLTDSLTPIAFRTMFSTMIFWAIWQYPYVIALAFKMAGHPLAGDEGEVFALPMNYPVAGIYGLFLDYALGFVPFLKNQLPQLPQVNYNDSPETTAKSNTVTPTVKP